MELSLPKRGGRGSKITPSLEFTRVKIARLEIACGDEFSEIFRDRLQWAVDNQGGNFAGRYIVTNCGVAGLGATWAL